MSRAIASRTSYLHTRTAPRKSIVEKINGFEGDVDVNDGDSDLDIINVVAKDLKTTVTDGYINGQLSIHVFNFATNARSRCNQGRIRRF
jgi:hypothetical protein